MATLDQFNLYAAFRRLVADRHSKTLSPDNLIVFMRENGHEWVGPNEALLFLSEFANESFREASGKNDADLT